MTGQSVNRPSWKEYFLAIAAVVATRSTCPRASIGAVLVKDKRIVATGYNGALVGELHCLDVGCLLDSGHCQRAIHAEINVIGQAARFGLSTEGTTLYIHCDSHITDMCRECRKAVLAAGIKEVILG